MERFEEIMIYREGNGGGKMETNNIVMILEPEQYYKFNNKKFIKVENNPETNIIKINKPPITTITGEWNHGNIIKSTSLNELYKLMSSHSIDSDDFMKEDYFGMEDSDSDYSNSDSENINKNTFSNILGNNVKLECIDNNYYFKPVIATKENVAYYNCKLLDENDIFFNNSNDNIALYNMSITSGYVRDYIMDEDKGGGIYLEYHNLPHIHLPINENSNGYIILAKQKKSNCYDVSAFIIPYGKALYIEPNVIHNDCFLLGDWNVMYGKAKNYSTAILKNGVNLVKFKFI